MKKVIAIYPGSFDPPTNGHLDLIERGSKIFDELVVAILRNPDKDPLFSLGERRAMLEALTADFKNVRVDVFDGLTVDYAARVKASAVLRGIRALERLRIRAADGDDESQAAARPGNGFHDAGRASTHI